MIVQVRPPLILKVAKELGGCELRLRRQLDIFRDLSLSFRLFRGRSCLDDARRGWCSLDNYRRRRCSDLPGLLLTNWRLAFYCILDASRPPPSFWSDF